MKKALTPLLLGLSLVASASPALQASSSCHDDPQAEFPHLARAIDQRERTVMILANDYETDPDSNLAGILAVGRAAHKHFLSAAQHPLVFIAYADDEYLPQDILNVSENASRFDKEPLLKSHYTDAEMLDFIKAANPERGFRVQDVAVDFLSLASFLNDRFGRNVVQMHVVQGERTRGANATKEPYVNPYLGNFGRAYGPQEHVLIDQIHPTIGTKGVLELLQGPYKDHKQFLLSGGSMRLALELAQQAPDLTKKMHAISVVGRIETPHSTLFNRQPSRPGGSWNARIDPQAFRDFFELTAANPDTYKSLSVVDSGTIFYAPVFDEEPGHLPLYADGLSILGYDKFLPTAALASKNKVEQLHTQFAWGFKPKAMDPVSILWALGFVELSMKERLWQHIYHQFAPEDADPNADIRGIKMSMPWTEHGHPFVSTFPGRGETPEAFAQRLEAYAETGYQHEAVQKAGTALKANLLREILAFGTLIHQLLDPSDQPNKRMRTSQ